MVRLIIMLVVLAFVFGCQSDQKEKAEEEGEVPAQVHETAPLVEEVKTRVVFFELQNGAGSEAHAELIDSIVKAIHGRYAWPGPSGAVDVGDTLPSYWNPVNGPVLKFFSTEKVTALRFRDSRKIRMRVLEDLPDGRIQVDTDVYANESNQWKKIADPGLFRFPSDDAWTKRQVLPDRTALAKSLSELIVLLAYK